MAVRKTESVVPTIPGFSLNDLGQNAASPTNAGVKLVSYLTAPLTINILQNYVVFVEDATLQPNVASYEWVFNNNGTITNTTTTNGVASFTPTVTGNLSVTVNLKNSANAVLHTVSLQQSVVARNLELEQLIDQEGTTAPTAANPAVSRDLINGLRALADMAASPVTDNALNRLILSLTYSNLLANTAVLRNTLLENCAAALETTPDTFFTTAQNGIGVTKLRPHLAAMFIRNGPNPLIAVTERPNGANASVSAATLTTIRTNFNGLAATRIDLFNLLRFPKSNFKICQIVFEGLKNRYFSGETFPTVLGNRNKARRLLSQFQGGPYGVPSSGTSDLTSASSSTFNLMLMPIWRISATASSNPGGTIDPQTRRFGIPEPIPERTFMAASGMFPGDAPFINAGQAYHQSFDINFTTINSLHQIIDDLQGNSTIVNHLRIFTHANESLLGLSLFRNGAGFVEAGHLDGFATSELRGVQGVLGVYFVGGYIFGSNRTQRVLDFLRGRNDPSLTPFGLNVAGVALSDDLQELFRRYMDIWLVNIPGTISVLVGAGPARNLTAPERNDIIALVNLIIRLHRPSITAAIAGLTDAHFDALRNAILGVTPADLGYAAGGLPYIWPPFRDDAFPNNLFTLLMRDFRSTVTALPAGNNFMTRLGHVKNNRFNRTSTIDIRGCRAGALPAGAAPPPPFLLSIQRFFGGALLPVVQGPEWFQSFQANFRNDPRADNASVDTLFAGGFNTGGITLTSLEVSDAFDTWSQLANLDDQFTFFTNLFAAGIDLVDFASLRWRTWRIQGAAVGIPALNLFSPRADDMVQLGLGDLLNRLRENFSAAGANLAAPLVTKLNALQPMIDTFRTNEADVAAFTGADLTTLYNSLNTLAGQITAVPGMPAPGSALVTTPMPAPLNRALITGYLTNIRTYLNTSLTTDINTIVTNIRTAIAAANAKRHYYFNLRLPLRVHTASGNFVQFVVFYIDGAASDAIKSYMKCQWIGTESQIADMHNFINARVITDANGADFLKTAILVESEISAILNAVAPLPDYNSHIRST